MIVQGNIVDIVNRRIYKGEIVCEAGKIAAIREANHKEEAYIIPGFIDAHIHIESSMLMPSEFARIALQYGTVATISDPHEIANVLGEEGVHFMIENGKKVPLKFHFGAPSCVPATSFESAGAIIDADGIQRLLQHPDIYYLAEMMNYPGVIYKDAEVLQKLAHAKASQKPIDGHAPGVRGADLDRYIEEGITTDHESFTYEEALEKLQKGMKILIREGSAAKNFEALYPLIDAYYEQMMFCSDDKHPDDLMEGHINQICARAIAKGADVFKVLQMACLNPIAHYGMKVGQLRVGDAADFIKVRDLRKLEPLETYIDGKLVAVKGKAFIDSIPLERPNQFNATEKSLDDFEYQSSSETIQAIHALDGELITKKIEMPATSIAGNLVSNTDLDVLKIVVVNRYQDTPPAIGFIHGFGLQKGAIASSVAHDSHNIIALGVSDEAIKQAVNTIIQHKGGICAVEAQEVQVLPLPIAGIISDTDAQTVAQQYTQIDAKAKAMGTDLHAPFMTLSFMALLVIPALKLSDKGLFDGQTFSFTSVEVK